MKWLKIVVFFQFAIIFVRCQGQLNNTQLNYNISIYEIKYDVNNEKVPHILTDLVMKNTYINNMEFQKVLLDLNINSLPSFYQELWIKPGIEVLFEESPTDLPKFIRKVVDGFPNKITTLTTVLQLLNIDVPSFIQALAFDNEDQLYKYLRSVSYDATILQQVYKEANTTLADLVKLAQVEIIGPITQKPFKECLDIFGESRVENLLNQSLYNVQVENINQDSLIYSILTNLTTILNEQTIWAVETKNGIISIPKTQHMYEETKDYMEVVLVDNLGQTKIIRNISIDYGKTYSMIQIDNNTLSSDVIITNDYKTIPDDCTYLKKSGGEVEIINATILEKKEWFVYVSYSELHINIGTPLICNKIVYGLLTNQTDEKLQFLLLRSDLDYDSIEIDYPDEDEDDDHDGSFIPQLSVICILLSFVVNLVFNF